MPRLLHILLAIVAGALAGGAAGRGIAGVLQATVGANEVITTIMLNYIALWVGVYLFGLGGPLQTDTAARRADLQRRPRAGARLPVFWGDPELQGLHIGLFLALAALVVFWVLLNRSTRGYEVARGRLQPRGGALRRHQRPAHLCARDGDVRRVRRPGRGDGRARVAVPARRPTTSRSRRSASSGSRSRCWAATPRSGTCVGALLFGALLNGTSVRNLDPAVFAPELATTSR